MLSPTGAGPRDGVDEESTNHLDGERETAAVLEPAEVLAVAPGADTGVQESPANDFAFPGTHRNGAIHVSLTDEARLPAVPQPVGPGAVGEAPISSAADTSSTSECPDHVRALLDTAPLVISCEDESLWSIRGRLALPRQSAFIELLVYLGAARLQAPEPLDPWPGVAVDTLLDEVWTPRARDPPNRESGQTGLRKSLKRLQEELATAAGGLPGEIVAGGQLLRLNPTTIASDVEVFLTALARAKAARGADRIAAAEEALAKRVCGLLLNVPRERVLVGRTFEIYRWLDLPHWERAAGRLEALGREAAVQLGRAYRDGGRYDAAMVLYGQLLGEVPHDRRVQEGLLLAARGTGDCTQLSQVWQQVRAYLDGETDIELHSMYERLMSETRAVGAAVGGR
jgi:DNA-binding SARP family transcriptional activator